MTRFQALAAAVVMLLPAAGVEHAWQKGCSASAGRGVPVLCSPFASHPRRVVL